LVQLELLFLPFTVPEKRPIKVKILHSVPLTSIGSLKAPMVILPFPILVQSFPSSAF
jgi:hypothetical protein